MNASKSMETIDEQDGGYDDHLLKSGQLLTTVFIPEVRIRAFKPTNRSKSGSSDLSLVLFPTSNLIEIHNLSSNTIGACKPREKMRQR